MPILIVLALLAILGLQAPRGPARMPRRHPRIAHFTPYLFGDSLKAILKAARKRYRYIDQNGTTDAEDVVWVNHWPKFRKGGYRWIWTGKRDRKGREVRRPVPASWGKIQTLQTWQVSRLRSRKRGGRRPYRARAHMNLCAEHDLIWCFEAKGSPGFRRGATWDQLRDDAVASGVEMVVMTLSSQGGPEEASGRLLLAQERGFKVAVLPRGRRPSQAVWDRTYGRIDGLVIWNKSGVWR